MTESEQGQFLVEWSDERGRNRREFPVKESLVAWFRRIAGLHSESIALSMGDQHLTYAELEAKSNSLAVRLIAAGVRLESRVGICMERSLEMVIGILGILKAGGAYVPLDPNYPQGRLEYMIRDSEIQAMVCECDTASRFANFEGQLTTVSPNENSGIENHGVPEVLIPPDAAAYVIYTSGSTGLPKGCVLTHANVVRLFLCCESLYSFTSNDVWTLFHSISFDFSVWEIWGALLYGGRIVVVSYATSRSPKDFWDLLINDGVTVLNQTPSAFRQLMQFEPESSIDRLCLRYVIFGGEALEPRILRTWFQRHGDSKPELINMYGITETTVHVTYRKLTTHDAAIGGSPIGIPLPDLSIYLLDEAGVPVPIGVEGEIYVYGPGLARGYLNRAELTDARFVRTPFLKCPPGLFYRSGDLARWNDDGSLEFLGRIDKQVKIRGHRVELGEIEAATGEFPGVATCAVIACEIGDDDTRLICYIVAASNSTIRQVELDQHLRQRLPIYMVPSAYVQIPYIPLTVNGKVDRTALPAPDGSLESWGTPFTKPQTPLEECLASIWCEILRLDRVGIHDNFLHLGGHSLLAMRVTSQLSVQLGRDVPVRWLFEFPTIAELSKRIERQEGELSTASPIPRIDRGHPLPASPGQQALWILQNLLPDSATYNQSFAWHFSGRVDSVRIQEALRTIVRRHEVLRTALVSVDNTLVQQVLDAEEVPLPWSEWNRIDDPSLASPSDRTARLIEETRRIFDLGRAPLWRVCLFEIADDEQLLVFTFHHSIIDEWSVRLLVKELETLYAAKGEAEPARLAELTVQYADFAHWQLAKMTGVLWEQHVCYWKEQLSELPPPLDLCHDGRGSTLLNGDGAVHEFRLPENSIVGLRRLAREESTTLFAVLLAGFQAFLYRYSGQTDVIVGTPYADRNHPDSQPLIGYFLNTLPIRNQLEPGQSFRSSSRQVKQTLWEAYSHADVPFEKMVELVAKERESGHHPIFQVLFVLLEEATGPLQFGEVKGDPVFSHSGTSKVDLTLEIQASGDEWVCQFEYATDLFDATSIERMAGHFQTLVSGIAENPDAKIESLPLLTESEQHQILVEWNQTRRDYPLDKSLHQFFEEQVLRTPGTIAVEFENQTLTYDELNRRANRLAHELIADGVGPDVLVGVYAVRSLEMVIALLGILKASGAYVPIDPEYPPDRVAYMLEDAKIPIVLTQHRVVDSLPLHSAKVRFLDSDLLPDVSRYDDNPPHQVSALNMAYMIYTSGSTGRPKGAMNTHRGIVNRLLWMQEQYGLTQADVVLQKTPFSFDVSVWEFFWPLLNGARLTVARPGGHREASYLVNLIQSRRVTVLHFVPSMLSVFLEAAGVEGCTSVRHVICSGEALSADLRDRLFSRLNVHLHNLYGPTEAAVDVTHWSCTPSDRERFVPIGRPVSNTQCYILNESLKPVPVGVPGELYLGGVQVGRGYHRQPELTAQKFLPDPFQADAEAHLYKTGDLCRYLPSGHIQYLGRLDNQVKIRGFRIELGEIESVLNDCPQLSQSVVVLREDRPGDTRLVAYVVPADVSSPPSIQELRQFQERQLPEYMIPSTFVVLDRIPLTVNGKVDRTALPAPDGSLESWGTPFTKPQTPLEECLASIWCEILRLDRVGIHDNFLHLGGHSLLAMRVTSQLSVQLGRDVPVRWLFEFPTIAELSKRIERQEGELSTASPIPRIDRGHPLPASPGQQALWILQNLLPDSATYNQSFAWHFSGRVDSVRIQEALRTIVRRHEVLRTALVSVDNTLVQQVLDAEEVPLPWSEWNRIDDPSLASPSDRTARLIEETRRIFDLGRAPLWRVCLFEIADDEQLLVFTFHHSIIDEWSVRLLVKELETLYAAKGEAEPARLAELTVQYADFAHWQLAKMTGVLWEQHVCYWKEQLSELPPPLDLCHDGRGSTLLNGDGAVHEFRLPENSIVGLRRLAREESTTLFAVLLAGFQAFLYRYSGQTDVIVGTPYADRNHPDSQPLIGYFLNTLPIRNQLEPGQSFRSSSRQVKQTLWEAYSHADVPFEKMVELVAKERESGHHPIFQVLFVLLEEATGPLQFGEVKGDPVFSHSGTSKVDLTLEIQASGDEWVCQFEYATDLFDATSIERMAGHFQTLVSGIAENPDAKIESLPLLTESEQHQILVEWNQTRQDYPHDKSVHQLFEEQVVRTPNATAVEFEEESLTYSELNRRANQLARHIKKRGVDSETRVGISVDRSLDMLIGLLAILKAGGCYVPLDSHYPDERLSYLVSDTGLSLILTQSRLQDRWQGFPADILLLDEKDPVWKRESIENLPGEFSADHLAYIIYTSGSTGIPKGVEVLHRGIVRLVCGADYVQLDSTQSVLQLAVLSFDASTFEIWGPLLNGGRCVLAPQQLPTAHDLQHLIRQKRIRTLWLTAALFNAIVDDHVAALEGIEQLLVGGETLSVPHVRRALQALGPQTQLINGYGPTECTTFACCYRLPGEIPAECESIPIGRPISNTTAYVLDALRQPVPIGVVGELCLGGAGLARSYLNQPELTNERFVMSSWGERLYHTGDLVRWRSDGTIEFCGRRDQQVKLRGFRIELGEIESILIRHPGIRQAVVMIREDRPADKQLVAYVVPSSPWGESINVQLSSYLRNQLPDYMIPAVFVELTELPRNANGKIDRQALPQPEFNPQPAEQRIVAPLTPLEEKLIQAWEKVLGVPQIGVHDNFFDLGGHSLMAIRVVDQINKSLQRNLSVMDLFSNLTVAELARHLERSASVSEKCLNRVYLEPLHSGNHCTHLIIVGATIRAKADDFLDRTSIWWLKLDGLHVLPHRDLDIPSQATAYIEELIDTIPRGNLLLCGHSYGGLLAIEIAHQLKDAPQYHLELVLLEPSSAWSPRESVLQLLTHYAKDLRKPNQIGRTQHLLKRCFKKITHRILKSFATQRHKQANTIEFHTFQRMVPYMLQHIHEYRFPQRVSNDIHLIGTPDYLKSHADDLQARVSGTLTVYPVPDTFSHLDIALPENNHLWVNIVNRLIEQCDFSQNADDGSRYTQQ